jgi:hypothetical protein
MSGFGGFDEVRTELQRDFRQSLVNLVVRPEAFEEARDRDYVVGRDEFNGRRVRVALAPRRAYEGRPSLRHRLMQAGGAGVGGTLVLTDCSMNRNGTYEAFDAVPFGPGVPVLLDGVARVAAPYQLEDGTWRQSVQHLRSGRARACSSYAEVVDATVAALSEAGPGRSGAVVRGWHSERGGAIGFEILSVYDPDPSEYLPADASFDAFLMSPDVFVSGLNASATGERCMAIVARMLETSRGEVVWEVIPKRTYSLGGLAAQAAALGKGRDRSAPYRLEPGDTGVTTTGCLPTAIGFVERQGVLWPRMAVPLRSGRPVREIRVATARVSPAPEENVPLTGRHSPGAPGGERTRPCAMAAARDSAPPVPPDLMRGLVPVSDLDRGGPDGCEDVAAIARLEESMAGRRPVGVPG